MTAGWAATNTLRETLDYMEAITLALGPGERTTKLADARAALAASALRAVREGTQA